MKKNLTETEIEIFNARATGVSFCDLSKEDFEISLTGVLFNVSVICGCQLPTHPAHIEALEKEFGVFLMDYGYSGLTYEEVLTAFRMNSNFKLAEKIESYGAIFNIDFAGKVLRLYRDKRGVIDDRAEVIINRKEAKEILDAEDKARRDKVISQFEKYIQDENAELDLSNCFMQLREDGAFSNKSISDGAELFIGTTELQRLFHGFKNLDERFDREKKMVLFLFKNMKATGKMKVYDENDQLLYPGFELPQDMFFKKPDEKERLPY